MSYSTELLDKINAISSFINTHRCDHQVWLNIETLKYQWKFIFLPESIWWEIISLNIPLPTGNIFLGKNISTHSFLNEKLSDKCTKIKSSGTNSFQSIRVYVSSNGTCTLKKDRILHVTPHISIYYRARESIIKIYGSIYPLSSNTHLVKVQI